MKRLFLLFLFGLNTVASTAVHAEKADATKDLAYESDHIKIDEAKKITTLTGNVVLVRGTMTMKAEKVVLQDDAAGYTQANLYAAPGALSTFRQKRDGGADLWMEGQGERIEYSSKTDIVKLINRAKVRQLDGNKPSDEIEGEFISYDSRTEVFLGANTASGESKTGGGRVKGVIKHTDQKGK